MYFYNKQRLRDNAVLLRDNTRDYLKLHREKILRVIEFIKFKLGILIENSKKSFSDMKNIIKDRVLESMDSKNNKLDNISRLIRSLHPQNVLRRGFSITKDKLTGKVLKSIENIDSGSIIVTEVIDGDIESKVFKIMKGERK